MKTYKENRKPFAYYALGFYMTIAVYDISYVEDAVLVAATFSDENGTERTKLTWCKIRYNKSGEAFFKKFGRNYFFNEMVRL